MASKLLLFVGSLNREVPYFQGARGRGLAAFSFDEETGEADLLAETTDIDNPTFLSVGPGGLVYANSEVPAWREGVVSAYRFDAAANAFVYLNKQPTLGSVAAYNRISRDGRFLLLANYADGFGGPDQSLVVFPIRPDGSLAPAVSSLKFEGTGPDPLRQDRGHAHSIVEAPEGGFFVAADLGIDLLILLTLGEDGELTERSRLRLPSGSGPRHIAFHPAGSALFVNNELASTIATVAVEMGALRLADVVPAIPAGVESHGADIHLSPDGRFVYSSNRGHDSISIFAVDPADRSLSLVGHAPTGGKTPRNFAISPSGRTLLVANQNSDEVVVFSRDTATGLLAETGRRIAVGTPMCVRLVEP